ILDWHQKGTRYNIHMSEDGLLCGGIEGVQLTWMDAKVDDWVVTPRLCQSSAGGMPSLPCLIRKAGKFAKVTCFCFSSRRILATLCTKYRGAT
ncbi:MAG: amylo-alpha-1,6-glucosidase, partial [Pseudomonadota bacterium]